MQKALRLMNIRLDVAIRDVTSKSGLAIIDAILVGQRDPHELASLVDIRMKRSKEEIAKSLNGSWRQEYLFELKATRSFYRHIDSKFYFKIYYLYQAKTEINMIDLKMVKK